MRKVQRRVEKLSQRDPEQLQLPLGACARVALSSGDVRAMSADLEGDAVEPPEPLPPAASRPPSASRQTTTSVAITYFDIVPARRSPSRVSSSGRTARSGIASRNYAIAETSSAS